MSKKHGLLLWFDENSGQIIIGWLPKIVIVQRLTAHKGVDNMRTSPPEKG